MKRLKLNLVTRRQLWGLVFVVPFLAGLLMLFLPNMIDTIRFTFHDIKLTDGSYELKSVGAINYFHAMRKDPRFPILLIGSLRTLGTQVPVILIFSLFIAVLLNQKFKGRAITRAIFFLPVIAATGIISQVETVTQNYVASNSLDLGIGGAIDFAQIESLLYSLNFSSQITQIVSTAVNGIYKVVQSSGMQIFIFLAALQEVPYSMYEAAEVEGCGKWQLFWKITFPIISPQILVNSVYTIVDAFSNSESELFLYVDNLAYISNQYGLATSMYLIYFLCVGTMIGIVGFFMSRFVFYNE